MFWSLFIFSKHSTREPASTVYNDEKGDLFYSAGPHRNRCNLHYSQHRKNSGKVWGKNAGEWTGRVETSEEEIPGSRRSKNPTGKICDLFVFVLYVA